MRTKAVVLSLGEIMRFAACKKEHDQVLPMGTDEVGAEKSSSALNITANWAAGGTTLEAAAAHAAGTNTARVVNNGIGSDMIFQRWDQGGSNNFGRTSGTATHAFAYTGADRVSAVPFAVGTRDQDGAEAIWTPRFANVLPRAVNTGVFVTDNGPGDLDPAINVIDLGSFRAQGIISGAGIPRVTIEEKINGSWVRVARTDGPQGRCELLAFTVVDVRSAYTVSGGVASAPVLKTIPVLKARNTATNKMELWTVPLIPQGINTGASNMYIFP
jgi:hypothetical protein